MMVISHMESFDEKKFGFMIWILMCFSKAQLILALANSYKNVLEHIEWVECIFEGGDIEC